jgi:hypothetical protein
MALKKYRCRQYPKLTIAGVCQFENNEFSTGSVVVQSKIEMSQSFHNGFITIADVDPEIAVQATELKATPWSEIQKMKKAQLVEIADAAGLEYGDDATRADILALVAAERRREE